MAHPEKYIKRPVPVDAMLYSYHTWPDMEKWLTRHEQVFVLQENGTLKLFTFDGWQVCHPFDWILHGAGGEFYTCRGDVFKRTYELYIDMEDDLK